MSELVGLPRSASTATGHGQPRGGLCTTPVRRAEGDQMVSRAHSLGELPARTEGLRRETSGTRVPRREGSYQPGPFRAGAPQKPGPQHHHLTSHPGASETRVGPALDPPGWSCSGSIRIRWPLRAVPSSETAWAQHAACHAGRPVVENPVLTPSQWHADSFARDGFRAAWQRACHLVTGRRQDCQVQQADVRLHDHGGTQAWPMLDVLRPAFRRVSGMPPSATRRAIAHACSTEPRGASAIATRS